MTGRTTGVAVTREADGGFVVDAALVAPGLGLTPEAFMAALRKGLVFQIHESGTGEDSGTHRLTFRYRSREWRLIVDDEGLVLQAGPGPLDGHRAH
jgi:uncharacterized protein (UPF0276 family)